MLRQQLVTILYEFLIYLQKSLGFCVRKVRDCVEKWFPLGSLESSNPQPPSKNEIELKEKEATQKKRLKEVQIATRRHKIPLPHNAT